MLDDMVHVNQKDAHRYANCLMATLNTRLILRNMADGSKTVGVWDRLEFQPQSIARTIAVQIDADIELEHVHNTSVVRTSLAIR